MGDISRVSLFGKLDVLAYRAIEGATTFCKLRGNPYVELVHWFHQILQEQSSDLHGIIRASQIDLARLARDMTAALDRLPRGASSISDLSIHIEDAVERAWVWATLKFGDSRVRTGHVLLAILKTPQLRNVLFAVSNEFSRVDVEQLSEAFDRMVGSSPEASLSARDGSQTGSAEPAGPGTDSSAPVLGRQEALRRFTQDLTQRAREGKIDPVVGRDDEIRQIIDVLMRRRQNNPILTGEAGVGKTAVVEGFAQRIVRGDVPPALKEVSLLALDVVLLQAGASMKGEFEQRLRQVIDEVQASTRPIVLFIDEVHTLVGAGGPAGTGDAANLLKPALARGTLRTIGATTWTEYKKYIEKDPALTRRFQIIKIDEPSEERSIRMLRGLVPVMEEHHRVQILAEALEAAVKFARRYIPDRQLPDKAVSLLDTACARVAVSQHAVPAEIEDCERRIESLEMELGIIERERAIGIECGERDSSAREALEVERARREERRAAWDEERSIVQQIVGLRTRLQGSDGGAAQSAAFTDEERRETLATLKELQGRLESLQGDRPLIAPSVDRNIVGRVVSDWTGIPVGRMVKDEVAAVLGLAQSLGRRVIGQDHALEMIARRVQTARAGLENPEKPIGVFLLAGPSGVGKTETALTLAEALYGGEQNLITINMSEFQEAHTVSTLKGAPPGYVGYGEGGVLTEAVRRKPYSVVLLDEVEKAHSDVHEIFFQVFDKGAMEDSEGRLIDFKNTLIILTTNVGTDLIMGMCKDPELMPEPEALAKALRAPLLKSFPAALLGRMITIPYYPLSDAMMRRIVRLQLDRIAKRLKSNQNIEMTYTDGVVGLVTSRCNEPESGGRMVDAILTNTLLPRLSLQLLERTSNGAAPVERIAVSVQNADFTYDLE
jgi:type VI secretion system protein VasG